MQRSFGQSTTGGCDNRQCNTSLKFAHTGSVYESAALVAAAALARALNPLTSNTVRYLAELVCTITKRTHTHTHNQDWQQCTHNSESESNVHTSNLCSASSTASMGITSILGCTLCACEDETVRKHNSNGSHQPP